MKLIIISFAVLAFVSCNNNSSSTKSGDTTTITTNPPNSADGGPNNGLGDTNSYNRMNDTASRDSVPKK